MTDRESHTSAERTGSRGGPIRVAVISAVEVLSEVIAFLLREHLDIELAGRGGSREEALRIVQSKKPDVIFLTLSGAVLNELNLIQQLAALDRAVKILVQSYNLNQDFLLYLLGSGARGIISIATNAKGVAEAIRKVHQGEFYLTPELQRACAERYLGVGAGRTPKERLSNREYQVMLLLARGRTNREIADELGIGVKTIDTHRANMLRKLGLRNNADVARFAMVHGLLEEYAVVEK
ncbi:MAG: DNA-binding response regulator [Acidobacteria bacterium]|nr:MAG: DNA-binding response regulator [Acidobacteriota bacterium]